MAGIPVFAVMGLVGPGVQGLMSGQIGASEQGRLQGANAGLMAIASMIGPILFSELFARAIGRWSSWAPPGSSFYLAAVLMFGALALALAIKPPATMSPKLSV